MKNTRDHTVRKTVAHLPGWRAFFRSYRFQKIWEKILVSFFFLNGFFAVFVLIGIFSLLFIEGFPAFKTISPKEFFLSTVWNPTSPVKEQYGILSLVVSTMLTTIGALAIATPLGIACAAYLSDIASQRVREIVKPAVEILAGIPSVVIGFLGLVVVAPIIARIFNLPNGLNALNGSILLAIMALPTIISLSEDALVSVPQEYKSASLALGANRWQTIVRVTIPSALSGIIASIMLGMGRAIGETMTVLMACGNAQAMPHSFLDAVRTMTATIAIELGETAYGSPHYHALFIIGFVLFLMTFLVNLVSDLILAKYQEVAR
jgi:phosphate transport system permease protein